MLTASSNGERELHPEGLFPAVCILMAGIGTQRTPYQNEDGTDKVQKKLVLGFETEKGVISRELTMSLSEKANLRGILESWRGKKFTQEELEGFDPEVLLGKPCTIQVIHNEKGTFANISNVLPKTGDFKATKIASMYDVDSHSEKDYEKLPVWIQKKVQESFEWAKVEKPEFDDAPEYTDDDAPIDLSEVPF